MGKLKHNVCVIAGYNEKRPRLFFYNCFSHLKSTFLPSKYLKTWEFNISLLYP